jgi:hypothetical protein
MCDFNSAKLGVLCVLRLSLLSQVFTAETQRGRGDRRENLKSKNHLFQLCETRRTLRLVCYGMSLLTECSAVMLTESGLPQRRKGAAEIAEKTLRVEPPSYSTPNPTSCSLARRGTSSAIHELPGRSSGCSRLSESSDFHPATRSAGSGCATVAARSSFPAFD